MILSLQIYNIFIYFCVKYYISYLCITPRTFFLNLPQAGPAFAQKYFPHTITTQTSMLDHLG